MVFTAPYASFTVATWAAVRQFSLDEVVHCRLAGLNPHDSGLPTIPSVTRSLASHAVSTAFASSVTIDGGRSTCFSRRWFSRSWRLLNQRPSESRMISSSRVTRSFGTVGLLEG